METAIYGVIDGALRGELTQAELDRARKQIRALLAYNKESITNQAFKMAYFEHVAGDPQWHERAGERLLTITLDDVHRAAQKYLRPSQRTVGYFIPTNADDQIDESALEEIA